MSEDDRRIELAAQAIFLSHFGRMTVEPRWEKHAADNPAHAKQLRDQAKQMIDAARPYGKYSSLGWLF
jgi:hypothetical protein